MHFSTSVVAFALTGFVAATSSIAASESLLAAATASAPVSLSRAGAASSGAEIPAGMVTTHIVQVGGPNGSLAFYPSNVVAQAGDLVQFQFHPKVLG